VRTSYTGKVRLGLYDPTGDERVEYLEPRLCPASLVGARRMILKYNALVGLCSGLCRVLAIFPTRRPQLRSKVLDRQAYVKTKRCR
jgi:hypothetical protein